MHFWSALKTVSPSSSVHSSTQFWTKKSSTIMRVGLFRVRWQCHARYFSDTLDFGIWNCVLHIDYSHAFVLVCQLGKVKLKSKWIGCVNGNVRSLVFSLLWLGFTLSWDFTPLSLWKPFGSLTVDPWWVTIKKYRQDSKENRHLCEHIKRRFYQSL